MRDRTIYRSTVARREIAVANQIQHLKLYADTPEIRDSVVITCLISNIPPESLMSALQFDPTDIEVQQITGIKVLPDWFNDCVERAIKILESNR